MTDSTGRTGKSTKVTKTGRASSEAMTAKVQGWEARTRPAPGSAPSLAGSAAPRPASVPVPARVDLADYRRRKYQTASDELRWRYENDLPLG